MKPPPGRWGLTPGEKRALLLLIAALLIGSGYRWYQHRRPVAGVAITAEDSAAVQHIRQAFFDRNSGAPEVKTHSVSPAESERTIVNGLLDLNRADRASLEKLPGIGAVLAGRILDLRRKKGRFKNIDELLEVRGIGEKKLKAIRSRVFCGDADVIEKPEDSVTTR